MAENVTASISKSVVETNEAPFIPGQTVIKAVLEPETTADEYEAPAASIYDVPDDYDYSGTSTAQEYKNLVLNIETTGLNPYDSKLQMIAVIDPSESDSVIIFFDENEDVLLENFVSWFLDRNFTGLIGYNVAFDYRYLFVKACKYGILLPGWSELYLHDVMTTMKQVKQSYVSNSNKQGSLDVWAEYLLGTKPPYSQAEELDLYAKKEYDECKKYASYKTNAVFGLYLLTSYILGD